MSLYREISWQNFKRGRDVDIIKVWEGKRRIARSAGGRWEGKGKNHIPPRFIPCVLKRIAFRSTIQSKKMTFNYASLSV